MLNCSLLRLREGVLAQARENRIACCICFRRPNVISSFYKEALNGKPQWFLRGPSAFKCRLVWVFPVAEWIRRGFGGRTATSSQQTSFWLVFTRRNNSSRGFGMLAVVAVPHTVRRNARVSHTKSLQGGGNSDEYNQACPFMQCLRGICRNFSG